MNTTHTPVTLQALGTTNVAAAVVTFDGVEGEGDSKRNNGERRQPNVGLDLAVGRAFINLGEKLVERGYDALPVDFSLPEVGPEIEGAVVANGESYFFIPEYGQALPLNYDSKTDSFNFIRVEN